MNGLFAVRALWALLLLYGCAESESYRNADFQLEVQAPLPSDAARVRICVEGAGVRTHGANGARYGMPGLPDGQSATVTVDVIASAAADSAAADSAAADSAAADSAAADSAAADSAAADSAAADDEQEVTARTGPVVLLPSNPVVDAALVDFPSRSDGACPSCPARCEASGSSPEAAGSWLLAVRFRDDAPAD